MPRLLVWLAAAVAVLVAAGPAYARSSVGGKGFPSLAPMKWAQDSTKIFLTVSLGCKRDVKFKPTRDTFALSCTDAAGVVQTTTMLLREDILPDQSACTSKGGDEVCTLRKLHDHFWDRLPHSESEARNVKQDWSRWKDESEDSSPTDEPYSTKKEQKHVKTVTGSGFEEAVKSSSAVFVDASLPWCTQCAFTRKAFASAAAQLGGAQTSYGKSKPVSFVFLNALEEREAARAFNVSCSFPCKFFVARHGDDAAPEEIDAKGQESDIVQAIEARMAPLLSKVSTEEEVEAFAKRHAVSALALIKGGLMSKADASAEYAALKAAAAMLRGKVAVMWSDKAVGGASPPAMQLWVNGSQPRQVQLSTNSTVLARNLVAWSWGYDMFNYSWNKRELFDKVGLPVAHVFLDDAAATPETVQVFAAAAQEMRGKMAFVRLGRNDAFMLKDFGLPADSLPAFGIADAFDSKAKRYGMPDERLLPSPPKEIPDPSVSKPAEWNDEDDGEWEAPLIPNPEYTPSRRAARFTTAALVAFAHDFVAGKLRPSYKSEPVPSVDAPPGQVRVVVYANSHLQGAGTVSETGETEAVLLLLYKPWGASKDKALSVISKVADAFLNLPAMRVGKMDTAKNHIDAARFPNVDEYAAEPRVFLLAGAAVHEFTGPLAQGEILKFVAKNVPAVKAAWATKVKPRLAELKEAAEAAKRRAREAKEKEELAHAAEKKRLDDLAGERRLCYS